MGWNYSPNFDDYIIYCFGISSFLSVVKICQCASVRWRCHKQHAKCRMRNKKIKKQRTTVIWYLNYSLMLLAVCFFCNCSHGQLNEKCSCVPYGGSNRQVYERIRTNPWTSFAYHPALWELRPMRSQNECRFKCGRVFFYLTITFHLLHETVWFMEHLFVVFRDIYFSGSVWFSCFPMSVLLTKLNGTPKVLDTV